MSQVPDYIEPVVGWRCWKVDKDLPKYGLLPKLYSAAEHDFFWKPGVVAVAECRRGCHPEDIPGEGCGCGFYSARDYDHLMGLPTGYHKYDSDRDGEFRVVGKVANWGNVERYEHGWRAQFSYPIKLWIPFEAWRLADPLEEAYGVKVDFRNILRKQPAPE